MTSLKLVQSDPYSLKNLLLQYPSDWFIEQETLALAKESLPKLIDFYKGGCESNPKPSPLLSIISEPVKEVYSIPLFSKEFCKILMNEISNMKECLGFNPNPDEDELRQIPEIVLQDKIPQLYSSLFQVVLSVMNPIFLAIWNRRITSGGIQIANYNLKGKKQGAWHHDASSDISVVVPLNTGEYEGGGTEFYGRGIVSPLNTGSALIFPSYTHMHRGLAVGSGDRYLLVFWLKTEETPHE